MKNERILVTGGAGFIGSHVVNCLHDKGYKIRVMDLAEDINNFNFPSGIEKFKGSILDTNDVSNAIRGCDKVVHLAAMLGVKRTDIKRLNTLNINIQGTRNIVDECIKSNIKKIIFSSSSEVYGDSQSDMISEDTPLSPKSIYAISKLAGEEYIKAYSKEYGIDYTIVRYFNVYGPRQIAEFVMPRFIRMVMDNKQPIIYGDGNQIRSFCYISDIAEGTYLAISNKNSTNEVFNIGNDSEPISIRELANKIISVSGKKIEPRYVTFKESDRNESREVYRRIPSIKKAKCMLGYTPQVSLEDGIKNVIKYGNIKETWFEALEI